MTWIHSSLVSSQQEYNLFSKSRWAESKSCRAEGLKNRKWSASCLISPTAETSVPSIHLSLTFLHSRWTAVQYISHSCFIRCWPTAWNICAAREKKYQIRSVSRDCVCGVGYVKRWNVQAGKSIKRMMKFFKVTAMERASRTVAVTFKIWILTFTCMVCYKTVHLCIGRALQLHRYAEFSSNLNQNSPACNLIAIFNLN